MDIVYLKADRHIKINTPQVLVGDVVRVYCASAALAEKVKAVPLFQFDIRESGRQKTVSIMAVIEKITACAGTEICIQNIGAEDFVMSLNYGQKPKKRAPLYKVLPVVLITFFGSAFAIMTYNEDVNTLGVLQKIADITGGGALGLKLMMVAYALGIAFGIILFFNHFGRKKMTSDPTPMEVEMEKYETDVEDTQIREASRKGETIDVP